MSDVYNLQRKIPLDLGQFQVFVDKLIPAVPEANGSQPAVAFVSDRRIRDLNKIFRGKDTATDVLSFPYAPEEFEPARDFLGDIVISAETASRQAADAGFTLDTEIKQLILHGTLHLCGYDHETDDGEMNAREVELRERLGI
jgi:probable rRNA maturation factor